MKDLGSVQKKSSAQVAPRQRISLSSLFPYVIEVFQTSDDKECAEMVKTGEWIVHDALYQGDKIVWCLFRF